MVGGIYLSLLIGPGVPVPAPREVVDALTSVTVHNATHGSSGFQLSFTLGKNSLLQTLFLLNGTGAGLAPPFRVILTVTLNGRTEVVIDGFMTRQTTNPGTVGQPSTLTIYGTDLTSVMQLIPFDGVPYPAMPVEARVLFVLAKYAALGVIPLVIPRILPDADMPLEHIPRHQGTDLAYLNLLADEAGYVFYLEPGPAPGTSTAYWGPEIKVGPPQPALTMNSDFETNVENIDFVFDNDGQVMPIAMVQEPITKVPIPIPIPNVSLANPPLGLIPPLPRRFEILDDTAKRSVPQAILLGLSRTARTADCVFGTGSLDVLRYGRLLKARRLVGVRGAGLAFDGLYYVADVRHTIKRGEYKQHFTLSRNGLVSTVPKVPA